MGVLQHIDIKMQQINENSYKAYIIAVDDAAEKV